LRSPRSRQATKRHEAVLVLPCVFEPFLAHSPLSLTTLIRKPMNPPHAFAERFEQRLAPAAGCVWRGLLICLLIGFGKETHVVNVSIDELSDRDDEVHVAVRLLLLHREKMKLGEFVSRLDLCK